MASTAGSNYTVYMHVFPNGKLYIGTTAKPPKERWKGGGGYRTQRKIKMAIQKYGWDNIDHVIIATNLSLTQASKLESDLIKYWNTTNINDGYNTYRGGVTTLTGYKHTEEAKRKIAEAGMGRSTVVSESTRKKISNSIKELWGDPAYANIDRRAKDFNFKRMKPLLQYTPTGVFVERWPSQRIASVYLHINEKSLNNCVKGSGRTTTSAGSIWILEEEFSEELLAQKVAKIAGFNKKKGRTNGINCSVKKSKR